MFTGLVEEKGILKEKIPTGDGFQFEIQAEKVLDDLTIGSSIAVNGCCLTVVKRTEKTFSVDTIEETLNKTNLGVLKQGEKVNLERPLKADARLGGHFVLGHIDTTGRIEEIKELSNSHWMTISFPERFKQYLIYVGSVAIDGVSMTVAELKDSKFSVGIIPHTWKETIFSDKKVGDTVNLEFDVLGKYVERIMNNKTSEE
ncbi:riboflavin synthase [Ignavibacterium sp.]|uniref:riboflavin synthase n=1 Tax=Ignavibacterium sp. TaxID=2651167 RepID=UPI0022047BD4|nr:riboflavin synthase [Ignavibacterium sp.]BDQ02717.1 MAG: riboflavin synthase subunit alpha [Ignavibacterium sp.]